MLPNYSRHASISSHTFDKIGYFRCIRRVAYCRNAHGIFPYANIILRKKSYFYITNAAASARTECIWYTLITILQTVREAAPCFQSPTNFYGTYVDVATQSARIHPERCSDRKSHYVPVSAMFQLNSMFRLVKSKLQRSSVIIGMYIGENQQKSWIDRKIWDS